jgi:hypothetical protein
MYDIHKSFTALNLVWLRKRHKKNEAAKVQTSLLRSVFKECETKVQRPPSDFGRHRFYARPASNNRRFSGRTRQEKHLHIVN